MQTDTHEWRTLMNQAAYSLIREQAPNELPLYVEIRDLYFTDPASFTARASGVDRPGGVGAIEAVATFTQTIFPLLAPLLTTLITAVATALQKEVTDQVVTKVQDLFTAPKPEPIFTQAQLETVAVEFTHIVETQQRRLNLNPEQVQAVKDAIIARLALAKKA